MLIALIAGVLAFAAVAANDPAVGGCEVGEPLDPARVGVAGGARILGQDASAVGEIAAVAELGAGWVRFDVDWSWIERRRGRYDWTATDRGVDAARAAGLRVLAVLAYTPSWARAAGTTDKHPPDDPQAFARFATTAAQRYAGRVEAWQVWNEPNTAAFWRPRPDAEAYAALALPAVDAIRRVDPDVTIVSAGLAAVGDLPDGSEQSQARYLRDLDEADALGVFDAIGLHPYTFSYPFSPLEPFDGNAFLALPDLHALIERLTGQDLPLWLTEYGFPTRPARTPDPEDGTVTEDRQRDYVIASIRQAQQWPFTGPLFLYTDRDRSDTDGFDTFGLRRFDGSPRPLYDALRSALTCRPTEPAR